MTEAELQKDCNTFLKKCDILFYHKEKGGYGRRAGQKSHSKGLPDLIIWHRGKCVFIELKTETGVQSPAQATFEARAFKAGFPYYICRDFDRFIGVLHEECIL